MQILDWKNVWKTRAKSLGLDQVDSYRLKDLIELDGFDSGAGEANPNSWLECMDLIRQELGFRIGDSLLEVGCGAGALIKSLAGEGENCFGFDVAPALIKIAERALPLGKFQVWDLAENGGKFPNHDPCDFTVIHGVLHYVTERSARETVREALRVTRKRIFIGEIPNIAMKGESESLREALLGRDLYQAMYRHLEHTYFDRAFFSSVLQESEFKSKWTAKFYPKSLLNTAQKDMRFAVLFSRARQVQ